MPAERPTRGRRGRISRSRDFDAVYRRGRSAAGRHLVVYVFARDDVDAMAPPRLGLSVSRKVGDAVTRNRVKRVLREQFARHAHTVPAGLDVVVIARPGSAAYLDEHGSDAVGERLGELLGRVAAMPAPERSDAA
jgi:ribonuclease P protein component